MNTKPMRALAGIALAMLLAGVGRGAPAAHYVVEVDTAALFGAAGFLDLQFSPGNALAAPATATLLGFSGDLTFTAPATADGAVSGTLPGATLFSNGATFNALLAPVNFGSRFGFALDLEITGPGAANVASRFSLAMLDTGFNPLLSIDGEGRLFTIDFAPEGAPAVQVFATGEPPAASVSAVPLPGALWLFGAGLLGLFGMVRRAR